MSIEDQVVSLNTQFKSDFEFWRPDRVRHKINQRMFWAVDHGQWPEEVVRDMVEQERQMPTINIIGDKIKGMIGLILKNTLDIKFGIMGEGINDTVMKLQRLWYSDYENMDFDAVYKELIKDMMVMYGCMRLGVTDEKDPLGNLALFHEDPYTLTFDPNWRSAFSKKLDYLYRHPMLSLKQIFEIYQHKIPELQEEYKRQQAEGTKNPGENKNYPEVDFEQRWGSSIRVVEKHYLETKKDEWEFDTVNREWFPDGDKKEKIDYARQMGLADDDIEILERTRRIYKIKTWAPDLTNRVLLEDREADIQIDRLPFFPIGYERYNGHYKGLTDVLFDIQQNVNKGIQDAVDIRQRTARGGAGFVDPAIVEGDEAMMQNIEQFWNRPGSKFWTKEGALMAGGNNYVLQLPESSIPQDLFALNNLMFELGDRMSTMPAASEGRAESSKESGRLFQSKYEAGIIAQGDMYKSLELMWAEIADAYTRAAKVTYGGQNNRSFAGYNNEDGFTINQVVGTGPNGQKIIKDDISKLPRVKITIRPSEKGLNTRLNNRITLGEIMHSLPKNLEIAPIALIKGIVQTTDMSEKFQEEMDKILGLEEAAAEARVERSIAENKLVAAQATIQLQGLMKQGLVAPGGGAPPPKAITGESPDTSGGQEALMRLGTPQENDLKQLGPILEKAI